MTISDHASRRGRFSRRRPSCRLSLEHLETRDLLSGPGSLLPPVPEIAPNDTLNHFQALGALDNAAATPVSGSIGNSTAGAADVDWYQFTLGAAAHVHLAASANHGSGLDAVLGLYDTDTGNTFDPEVVLTGHRLLTQVVGAGGAATLDRDLAAGTYYVAVSGKGNQAFYPLLANSGLAGETGDYLLQADGTTLSSPPLLLATDLGAPPVLDAVGNPVLDANGNPVLDRSPLTIRFDTSSPLDPSSNVHLFDVTGQPANVDVTTLNDLFPSFNISSLASELEVQPPKALAPGTYEVVVNDSSDDFSNSLFTTTFTVGGIEGNVGATTADDVIGGAHNLGDVTNGKIVQVAGTIGNDSYYDATNAGDPNQGNPANQVDLYRFHVGGSGNFALAAEAFAGRIGSPLQPALTLFRLDANNQPVLVAGAAGTLNDIRAEPDVGARSRTAPLSNDPALFASLTSGDYLLAVSTKFNYSDPSIGRHPGLNGAETQSVFDPTQSHSGTAGSGPLGDYVLNLRVQPANFQPRVVSAVVSSGGPASANVVGAPTDVDVRFSGPVNLRQLAYELSQRNLPADLTQVFIVNTNDPNSTPIVPRLATYDATTFDAHFILLDRLPAGTYALHLSGAKGLTDFSGSPVASNAPGGDFVFGFTVTASQVPGTAVPTKAGNDDVARAQDLGVVFDREFENHFTVRRDFTASAPVPADTADFYSFQVLQAGNYSFFLSGVSGTVSSPDLVDAAGKTMMRGSGGLVNVLDLQPGTYYLRVQGWSASAASATVYDLVFSTGSLQENPTPLTVGPAPALRLQLVSNVPPPAPPTPPVPPPVFTQLPPSPPESTLPTPPKPPPSGITATSGTTTGNTTPASDSGSPPPSALAGFLPGLANALAAGPIGGVRGPATSTDDGRQAVVLLNLTPPTYAAVDTSGTNRPGSTFGGSEDDTGIGFFGRLSTTWYRITQVSLQATGALFGTATFNRPNDAVGSEEQEPQPQSDIPGCGAADPAQGAEVTMVRLAAFGPSHEADSATSDPRAAIDGIWTLSLAFAGGLALLRKTDEDAEALRLALALHSPRDA